MLTVQPSGRFGISSSCNHLRTAVIDSVAAVVLKIHLDTHPFYSADKFMQFKRTHNPFRGYCTCTVCCVVVDLV
jgi:hypothetical protein